MQVFKVDARVTVAHTNSGITKLFLKLHNDYHFGFPLPECISNPLLCFFIPSQCICHKGFTLHCFAS